MENDTFAIIEIGSNNTKTHIYNGNDLIYENNTTIEFKKNYTLSKKIENSDMFKLYEVIECAKKYTASIHIFGCSIFRSITKEELKEICDDLNEKFGLNITVVSQEEEALLTAYGCYSDIQYDGNLCVFIGGGGSTELLIVQDKKVRKQIFLDFGVVDITKKFETLKEDIPSCTFDEVYSYIDALIEEIDIKCDLLILAGGDHLYWYNNANYTLFPNELYENEKQKYMIPTEVSDGYDRNALVTSLNAIRKRSDNPLWFDGSRAMKVLTNVVSHKLNAKYIIPTKINMEDGLKTRILNEDI